MTTRVFRGITYTVKTATGNGKILNGTAGADWIDALGGNNIINTGAGNDVVLAGVDFIEIADYPPYAGEAVFWNFRADAGNNIINVGAGDDYVASGGGNDTVYLGSGNDIYDGWTGNDTVYGGDGNDLIFSVGSGSKTVRIQVQQGVEELRE
jgi:Ca2+-binding RTX toxin-like protein